MYSIITVLLGGLLIANPVFAADSHFAKIGDQVDPNDPKSAKCDAEDDPSGIGSRPNAACVTLANKGCCATASKKEAKTRSGLTVNANLDPGYKYECDGGACPVAPAPTPGGGISACQQ